MNVDKRRRYQPVLNVLLSAVFTISLVGSAQAAPIERSATPTSLRVQAQPSGLRSLDPNRSVQVFVQLTTPSVAELVASSGGRAAADRSAQRAQARKIDAQQRQVRASMRKYVSKEHSALRVGVNGFRVQTLARHVDTLRRLPGVKSVAPVTLHTPDLSASVGWIGAPEVWDTLGNGEGVTVAILDTGIDYNHANLGGSGIVADYENNDPLVVEPGTFPTEKVVAGRDIVGQFDTCSGGPDWEPQPDDDPLDFNGHGSHVAGISAGLGVEGIIGPGVAKGASLVGVKVFGDESGCTDATADGIEYVLDPNGDGSMDDHFDVINMSLGAPFGDPNDASALASQNAAMAGVHVVASAGNEGDVPYVTGSPATGIGVISVASSIHGGRTALAINVASDDEAVAGMHEAVEGDGPVDLADAPRTALLVQTVSPPTDGNGNEIPGPPDGKACLPLDNATEMRGKIGLVQRGDCFFWEKFVHVQSAGGVGIVVYNDGEGEDRVDPIIMGGLIGTDPALIIPGVMVSSTAGYALRDSIAGGQPATATMDASLTVPGNSEQDDTISGFSSRGPGNDVGIRSRFKPDITAPGDAITSTLVGSGTDSLTIGGTSMAGPHVAGAAALMKVAFPELGSGPVKSLLMNSTVTANSDGPGTDTPYPLARQGTGVVRINQAVALTSFARPGGITFSRRNPVADMTLEKPMQIVNLDSSSRTFAGSHVEAHGMSGVTVSCPASIEVPGDGATASTVSIDISVADLPVEDSAFSQSEVDGWCVFTDGVDTLRVGYMAIVDPAAKMGAMNQTTVMNPGATQGWAEAFTLAGQGGLASEDGRHTIDALGFRTGEIEGIPVVEFGLATDVPWNTLSHLAIEIYIDADQDGIEDSVLFAGDWGLYFSGVLGSIVTGQFALDADGNPDFANGTVDWTVATGDYNDRVVVLPFSNDPAGGLSFLEAGDTSFDYRLVVTGWDEATDTQTGSIELGMEIDVDMPSFGLAAGDQASLVTNGKGHLLWLYPANHSMRQVQTVLMR